MIIDIEPSRKRGLFIVLLALAALGLAIWAVWFEPRSLGLQALEIASPAWPRTTPALRVAVLSDVHIDQVHMPPQRVREIAARVNALKPDIILLAGDYVGDDFLQTGPKWARAERRSDKKNALQVEGLRALGELKAPLGVYAVMGNHDCWWSCAKVREALADTQVVLLENRAARVVRPGGELWIVGAEDGQTQKPDFPAAGRLVPKGVASLTLVHNPGLFDWPSNSAPLQISGHTHGGQVRFPVIGAPIEASRHTEDTAKGWTIENGRILVVTRGLGVSGLPIRFGAPPQVMLLTIRPGLIAKVEAVPAPAF